MKKAYLIVIKSDLKAFIKAYLELDFVDIIKVSNSDEVSLSIEVDYTSGWEMFFLGKFFQRALDNK